MLSEEIYNKDPLFWDSVKILDENSCWEWIGTLNDSGYGVLRRRKKFRSMLRAHRYAMYLFDKLENINDKIKVLHKCDNPPCCNPFHLFLGTQLENIADMRNKGREHIMPSWPGEKNPRAKLSWEDVRKIREIAPMIGWGRYTILARQYGVSTTAIHDIINGKSWLEQLPN